MARTPSSLALQRGKSAPLETRALMSLELIRNLVNARLGTGLVAGLAVPAHSDRADRVVADIDRATPAERNHLGKQSLASRVLPRFRIMGPFQGRTAERTGGMGLAPAQLHAARRR